MSRFLGAVKMEVIVVDDLVTARTRIIIFFEFNSLNVLFGDHKIYGNYVDLKNIKKATRYYFVYNLNR